MSNLLQLNTPFLRLMYDTTKKQGLLLLRNTTPTQALVLSEISLNLLGLPLSLDQEKGIKKHLKILKRLAKKKTSVKSKQKLIATHSKVLYNILKTVEGPILRLI